MPECEAFPEVAIAGRPSEFAAALDPARERGRKDPRSPRAASARSAARTPGTPACDAVLDARRLRPRTARFPQLRSPAARARARRSPAVAPEPTDSAACRRCRAAATSAARRRASTTPIPPLFRESLTCAHCLTTCRYRSIARGTPRGGAASSRASRRRASPLRWTPASARRPAALRLRHADRLLRRRQRVPDSGPARAVFLDRRARRPRFEPRPEAGQALGGNADEPEPRGADVSGRVLRRRRHERRPRARAPGRRARTARSGAC